jgi:hypothetical protein
MSAFDADRSGRRRIRCTGAAERGDCPAPRTFYLDSVECLVLDALKAEMRKPDTIAAFVREYHTERQRLARNAQRAAPHLSAALRRSPVKLSAPSTASAKASETQLR